MYIDYRNNHRVFHHILQLEVAPNQFGECEATIQLTSATHWPCAVLSYQARASYP